MLTDALETRIRATLRAALDGAPDEFYTLTGVWPSAKAPQVLCYRLDAGPNAGRFIILEIGRRGSVEVYAQLQTSTHAGTAEVMRRLPDLERDADPAAVPGNTVILEGRLDYAPGAPA